MLLCHPDASEAGNLANLRGVPVGEAKITVVRLDPAQPDPYEAVHQARRQLAESKDADPKKITSGVVTDPVKLLELQKRRHLLPFSYSSPETTDLRFSVVPGANSFDIELFDRPKAK